MALSKINIPAIKAEIETLLEAEPTNLSADMTTAVQRVCQLNPGQLMGALQSTQLPAVCIFTSGKTVDPGTIAVNQVQAKRFSNLSITIAGLVWNQNFSGNLDIDPADNDVEHLMENIEAVLRNTPTLSGNATWQFTSDVTYHNAPFDEQTHFRIGLLELEIRVDY